MNNDAIEQAIKQVHEKARGEGRKEALDQLEIKCRQYCVDAVGRQTYEMNLVLKWIEEMR